MKTIATIARCSKQTDTAVTFFIWNHVPLSSFDATTTSLAMFLWFFLCFLVCFLDVSHCSFIAFLWQIMLASMWFTILPHIRRLHAPSYVTTCSFPLLSQLHAAIRFGFYVSCPLFCFLRSYVLSYDSPTEPPAALSCLYYISSHVADCMHTIDIYHIHLYVSACHTFTPIATTSHHFQHIKRHKQQQLSHDYPRIMTRPSDNHESASALSLVNPSALRRFQQLLYQKPKQKEREHSTLQQYSDPIDSSTCYVDMRRLFFSFRYRLSLTHYFSSAHSMLFFIRSVETTKQHNCSRYYFFPHRNSRFPNSFCSFCHLVFRMLVFARVLCLYPDAIEDIPYTCPSVSFALMPCLHSFPQQYRSSLLFPGSSRSCIYISYTLPSWKQRTHSPISSVQRPRRTSQHHHQQT